MATLPNGSALSTTGGVDAILKEYYLGPVQEQLNNDVLLVQRLESRSEDLVGRVAIVPLHTSRSGGIGAVGESASLPIAGNQGFAKAQYDLKYLYGRVQVTGPAMAKTKSDVGAFLQVLKAELDGIRNDLGKDLARQVYGYGDGVIATGTPTTTASAATRIITLANWEPLRKGQLYVGCVVQLFIASTGAAVPATTGDYTITATSIVGAASSTITVSSAATAITNVAHTIARAGSVTDGTTRYGTGTRSNEVDGLQRIITTVAPTSNTNTVSGTAATDEAGSGGYLGNISAYTNNYWDNQRTAVGGALTLQAMQTMANTIRTKGGQTSMIVTSLGVMREFYRLLTFVNGASTPIFDPSAGTMDFKAGFNSVSYNGVPVVGDIDAPYGNMYFLDESTLKVFSDQDWHFLDADGQTLRQVIGYDAYEAILTRYMNLGATNRAKNGVLSGITVNGSTDTGV
jgi:hypothetical protein